MVINYAAASGEAPREIRADISLSPENLLEALTQPNPETRGTRVFVTFYPGPRKMGEFQVQPLHLGQPVGETWLYRWTPE
jgi:glucans biosynthesis protein